MNILFVGERQDTGNIVQLLLEKSKHRLECKSLKAFPSRTWRPTTWYLSTAPCMVAPNR